MSFTQGTNALTITAPANANLCPPGKYMMFILNSAGVPSVASIVQVGTTVIPSPTPTASPSPTATPGPVKINAPANGATASGTVSIATQVSPSVVWINVYIDGKYLVSSPPYTFSWDSTKAANGSHTISAKAFGSGGALLGSDSVSVTVANGGTPTPTATATSTSSATATATPTATGTNATATPPATVTSTAGPVKITAPASGATVAGNVAYYRTGQSVGGLDQHLY
jgi:Domain of unknown function (DUF1929)/Bacterial Ig domain